MVVLRDTYALSSVTDAGGSVVAVPTLGGGRRIHDGKQAVWESLLFSVSKRKSFSENIPRNQISRL